MESLELLDQTFGHWKNEYVKYVSEDESNTCDECGKNDGRIFSLNDENLPQIPIHPRCRCKYVLLFNPQKNVTSLVEKNCTENILRKKHHLDDCTAKDLSMQIIAARKENSIIREQHRFLLFNGRYLFSSDGELLLDAASGKPVAERIVSGKTYGLGAIQTEIERTFDYSFSRQGIKEIGGIPQGLYHIKANEERSAITSPYSHIVRSSGWGTYAWLLHPDVSTDTRGRKGFFIHGGRDFGSAGCIDLQYKDTVFRDYFQKTKQSTIFVFVRYEKENASIRETKTNFLPFFQVMH